MDLSVRIPAPQTSSESKRLWIEFVDKSSEIAVSSHSDSSSDERITLTFLPDDLFL